MQEQEHDIGVESPLSLELRQHGTTQTIAVVGLELGPFSLSCELEPLIQDLDDQDLAVVLRGSSTRLRSLDLTVRYDALKDFVVSQLVSHRSITRVRVIAEGNGLGIMGVWSDSDCRAPFGLRLDLVAGFDSEIDLIVSRVALFGKSSISPIDLALLVADRLAISRLFEPMGPQVYHGSPLSTILRQAAPLYGWKVPQWRDCRLSSYALEGDEWKISFGTGLDLNSEEERFPANHPDALYTLDQTLRHRDIELALLGSHDESVQHYYADRLFDGDTSRWVAERAFQVAIADRALQAKVLDHAERWLIKDERSLAARALLVHAALEQNHPEMAERLLFELAELPTQARVHRRMGAAELYALRLAVAHVALDVDPVHAKEHYERVLAQNPDSILAYESLARLCSRLGESESAIKYGESYLVHEQDDAAKFEFLLFLGQEHLKLDNGADQASLVYRKALQIRPDDRRALTALADLALAREDTSSALRHLSRLSTTVADDVEPEEHVELLLKIAILWEKSIGDDTQAIDYLREAWRTQPRNARVVWPLVKLLKAREEHDEARALVLGLADSRVEDFEVAKAEIIEANHWLLKHGALSDSDRLLRLEHLHSTDPQDNELSERLWSALLDRNLETRAVHLATEMAEIEQGVIRAGWLLRAAELEVEVLKRFERAAEICTTLLSEHHDFRTAYPMVLDYDLKLPVDVMMSGYQHLKMHEFGPGFSSEWAASIAERLVGDDAWQWWVISANDEPRTDVVARLVELAENDGSVEKLALAYEARAIARSSDVDEWLKVAGLWEELREGDRVLEVLSLGAKSNPGDEKLTLRLAAALHAKFNPARALEVLNEALRHVEPATDAALSFHRGAAQYAQFDARPELESEALMALAKSGHATPDEISRLTSLLESLGQFADLAQLYEDLSQASDASPTSKRQDRLRAARAFRACGQVERAVDIFLLLMSDDSELSLEAARLLEPLAREMGEHSRHERSLEYQVKHDAGPRSVRALEELLALHIETQPVNKAKESAARLLSVDSSSPSAHYFLAECARRSGAFEETLHHLSSLLFARGRERGLSESTLRTLYIEATSLADIFEPKLSDRLRADYQLEFPSNEILVPDLVEEQKQLGNWPIVESLLKARQAWSAGQARDELVVERAEIMVEKLDRVSDATSLLERSLRLDEVPENRIWDALKAILLTQNDSASAFEKASGYMDHVLSPEHAYWWAIEAVNIAVRQAGLRSEGEHLLSSIQEVVPSNLRSDYRATLRRLELFDTLKAELQVSLDANWRVDDGRFKELVVLLSEGQHRPEIEALAEKAAVDYPYLDQGFEVLESLARDDRDVEALFDIYERWADAREGDDRYQLIRRTVELGDEQGDIRRSFEALRPAVDLVENPVPILEELYTRATQLEDHGASRDILDDLALAVIEPGRKEEVWNRLFVLSTGALDSLTDARRAFEGLGSPLSKLETFAAQLNRHQRQPELARTLELTLEALDAEQLQPELLGPVLFYLVDRDGGNFDSVMTRVANLEWPVESKIDQFRSWMNDTSSERVAMYLGLHVLSDHGDALGSAGVSEALEALTVQHDAPVWFRQRLAQFRTDSFRLAVSIFDAMWPAQGDGALHWLSRATDLSSDAQMLKLLESRQRALGLEVSGVQWLRDRQDLLGLSRDTWTTLAEHAEHSGRVAAAVESWLVVLSLSEAVPVEQAHHIVVLAIDSLQNFELAGRVVEQTQFEPRVLDYLVSKYIGDGDIESAVNWLARAERQQELSHKHAQYRKERMFLHLRSLDDYESALLIADEWEDEGELLEVLADELASGGDTRAVVPFETAIDRATERDDVSRRCSKLFGFSLEHQLEEHIQFALVHTFEPDGFFEALTDNALAQGNKRAAFEWLLEWGKNAKDEQEQELLYLRALELALHQCEDVQLARRVLGYTRKRSTHVDKIVRFYIAKQDYLEAVNELERASDLTSDTELIQSWLEHAVDLSLTRLEDLDGAKALAEMAPEPVSLLERTLAAAFSKGRESLGLEIARELVDAAPERDARDRSLRLLLDYVDEPQEVSNALRRLSSPSSHEKRRLVEILLAESDYDTLITMSHWGEVVDARTIVDVARLLSQHGEFEAGLRWLEPLLEIHPPHQEAWDCLEDSAQTPAFEASIGAAYLRWVDKWSPSDPSMLRVLGWNHLLRAGRRDLVPVAAEVAVELDSVAPHAVHEWLAVLEISTLIDDAQKMRAAVDGLMAKAAYGEGPWLLANERGYQLGIREGRDSDTLKFAKALCEAQPGRLDYADWYTQALRKAQQWSELQLFMEEQLESGLSDATNARTLIAESLFASGDEESGLEVLLRIDAEDRDRAWAEEVWNRSAALGRSESAYEAAKLFAEWESGASKAEWLRTAARLALWDLGWIDEGRKGLELAHAIHHEALEETLTKLSTEDDDAVRVRRYRELTWVWSAPDDEPLLNHWFDWAIESSDETLQEIFELCRAQDMLSDDRWINVLASDRVFSGEERKALLKEFALGQPLAYRLTAPLIRTLLEVDERLALLAGIEAELHQEPQLRADILFDLASMYEQQFKDQAKALGLYIQGVELSPRLDQQMKVAELSYELGYFSRTVEVSRAILPQLDDSSSTGIRLAKISFESALELQEERDIERIGDFLLKSKIMTLEAFDAWMTYLTPSWLSGRLSLCISWIDGLEVKDALKALLVARPSISETAPNLWQNLVESQTERLTESPEFQVLRLPWLERPARLSVQTPLLFQRPDLFESSKFDDLLFESAAWSMEAGLTKQFDLLIEYAETSEPRWMRLLLKSFQERDDELGAALLCLERMQVVDDEPLMRRLEAQLGHRANRVMLKGQMEDAVVLHEALIESRPLLFTERLSREVAWFLKHHTETSSKSLDDIYWAEVTSNSEMLHRIANKRLDEAFESLEFESVDSAIALAERLGRREDVTALVSELARRYPENLVIFQRAVATIVQVEDAFRLDELLRDFDELNATFVTGAECLRCGDALKRLGFDLEASYWFERALDQGVILSRRDGARLIETLLEKNPDSPRVRAMVRDVQQPLKLREYALERLLTLATDEAAIEECKLLHVELAPTGRIALSRRWEEALRSNSYSDILVAGQTVFAGLSESEQKDALIILDGLLERTEGVASWDVDFESWYGNAASLAKVIDWCGTERGPRLDGWLRKTWSTRIEDLLTEAANLGIHAEVSALRWALTLDIEDELWTSYGSRLLALAPESLTWPEFKRLGESLAERGDQFGAVQALETAIEELDSLEAVESLIELIGEDEDLQGRVLELRQERVRKGHGTDSDNLALGRDAASRGASEAAVSHFESIVDDAVLTEDALREWAQAYERLERSEDAVALWERIGGQEVEEARERMRLELAEASGDRNQLVDALVARLRDEGLSTEERQESAERLRDVAAEGELFEPLQEALAFLEMHLSDDDLEAVREERIMSAESEGDYELAAEVLKRVFDASSSNERAMVAERLETLLRVDVGDEERADRLLVECALIEDYEFDGWARSLEAAQRLDDDSGWLAIARRYADETLGATSLLRWAQLEQVQGDALQASNLYVEALKAPELLNAHVVEARQLAEELGEREQMRAYDWAILNQVPQESATPELLSFLETWYLEDGPLVEQAVERLQATDHELLRRTGEGLVGESSGYSQAAWAYRELTRRSPTNLDDSRTVARLAGNSANVELSYLHYQHLLSVLPSDDEARGYVSQCGEARPSFGRSLSAEEESLLEVSSPQLDWYWELMTAVNEVASEEGRDLERSFGIDSERDLLEATDARVKTVASALEWFGLASVEVYRWRGGGYRCVVQPGDTTRVLIGSTLATDAGDGELFVATVYSAALSAAGVNWCLSMEAEALEVALQGLVHAVAGEQPLMTLSEEALRRSTEYRRAIPQMILSGLEESVELFVNRHSQLGFQEALRALRSRALRFALVVSGGDLESTFTTFMRLAALDGWESEDRREAIGQSAELDALEEFHLSWEHSALRRELEFAFGVGSKEPNNERSA